MAPALLSSLHRTVNPHWPRLISRCAYSAWLSVATTKQESYQNATKPRHSDPPETPPIANLSLSVLPPLFPPLYPPPPLIIGQGGEPGTRASAYEQSFGRGLGPQADPRSVYRDLCAGHRQHAAQPGLSDDLGPRFDHLSARGGGPAASSTPPSPWGVHREDAPPVSGSWQQHVAPPPAPPPPPGSQHHAVQTQATQRGDFPSESWQDPHPNANILPGSLRRTHTRSH